ncbi:MAG: hypothetical protein J6S85_02625 [Methanobrevibacter sp.]|nr:hypothetical protein [Methanobrevibacter sp.]
MMNNTTKNTKKAYTEKQAANAFYYLKSWYYSEASELYQFYKSYSAAKASSYEYIKREAAAAGGSAVRITGGNCMLYSAAYIKPVFDEYGHAVNAELVYHTAYNTYIWNIKDICNAAPEYYNHPAVYTALLVAGVDRSARAAV